MCQLLITHQFQSHERLTIKLSSKVPTTSISQLQSLKEKFGLFYKWLPYYKLNLEYNLQPQK